MRGLPGDFLLPSTLDTAFDPTPDLGGQTWAFEYIRMLRVVGVGLRFGSCSS